MRLHEENPFLGWRGIRLTLDHPEIFLVQIRAMLRASLDCNNLQILLPMVTSAEEVDESIRLIHQAYYEVSDELGDDRLQQPQIGVMIEVPGVIYQLQNIASKVDFFQLVPMISPSIYWRSIAITAVSQTCMMPFIPACYMH